MSPIPGPPIVSTTLVQFVDSIDASPTVRLDLNDSVSFKTLSEGTSFNPPPLREAVASNMLSHGEYVSASSYGDRAVVLHLRLKAADEDGLRNLLRVLMVELNRDSNILRLQITSEPVFFLTKRSTPQDVDITDWGVDTCTVSVSLRAEPFAYGLRVDGATVIVMCDATVVNGFYLDVAGVTGDVETPAYLKIDSGTGASTGPILAIRRRGTPASAPFAFQAETATLGTDTALFADGTGATGAGSNTAQTTFATSTALGTRLTFASLGSGADLRGVYRVYARCRKTVTGDTITMRVVRAGVQYPTATLASGTAYQLADCGLVQMPPGQDSETGYSGVALPPTDVPWSVQIGRTAGTGNCIVDELLWLPADAEFAVAGPYALGATAIFDGPNDANYFTNSAVTTFGATDASIFARVGTIPKLTPDQANRLYAVPQSFVPADTFNVTPSFWPRYLTV